VYNMGLIFILIFGVLFIVSLCILDMVCLLG